MTANVSDTIELLPPETNRVLIVAIDRHLGNTLLALPVIEAFGAYFTHGIDLTIDERFAPLVQLLPSRPRLRLYPSQGQRRRSPLANIRPLMLMMELAKQRYDAVICLSWGKRSCWLTRMTFAPRRYGLFGGHPYRVFHTALRACGIHEFEQTATMLKCIGMSGTPPWLNLAAPAEAHEKLTQSLREHLPDDGSPIVVIHPGAGHPCRRWAAERFAAVADELVGLHNARVCIIGAPSERPIMDAVFAAMASGHRACRVHLPLVQLVALFERAMVIVSNESGPTHLASLTALPIATIFGPTSEERWRPYREERTVTIRGATCDPGCHSRQCVADMRCMTMVSVDQVVESVRKVTAAT